MNGAKAAFFLVFAASPVPQMKSPVRLHFVTGFSC